MCFEDNVDPDQLAPDEAIDQDLLVVNLCLFLKFLNRTDSKSMF